MWFCYLGGRRIVVIHRADDADDPIESSAPDKCASEALF